MSVPLSSIDEHAFTTLRPAIGSIRFIPDRGTVLRCDLRDYLVTEMGGKIRPAIVVSPRHHNREVVYIAPLTRSAEHARPHDICLPAGRYLFSDPCRDSWVKTQYVRPVDRSRLDRLHVDGTWCAPHISTDDLQRVLAAISAIFAAPQLAA